MPKVAFGAWQPDDMSSPHKVELAPEATRGRHKQIPRSWKYSRALTGAHLNAALLLLRVAADIRARNPSWIINY